VARLSSANLPTASCLFPPSHRSLISSTFLPFFFVSKGLLQSFISLTHSFLPSLSGHFSLVVPSCHFYSNMVLFSACLKTATLVASLPQTASNGNCMLGTEMAPHYPKYMTKNPMPDGYPWGTRTAKTSNPYTDMPDTGVTRYYNWTIDKMVLAPDGYCIALISCPSQPE